MTDDTDSHPLGFMLRQLSMTSEERDAERLANLVQQVRNYAESKRREGSRFRMDNMTYSADEAFRVFQFLGEAADRLEGKYSPPAGFG